VRDRVRIRVEGCVARAGDYELPAGSTVADVLEAAGGIRDQPPIVPTGNIILRGGPGASSIGIRKTLNFKIAPTAPAQEEVRDNDVIIVQVDGIGLVKSFAGDGSS
jgi:protein involved in polysaccharide export with SLBB domain